MDSSGGRGRSREPRSSYDDDDGSFESYDSYSSASDDESYEPADSDKHLGRSNTYGESTEYESDGSYEPASQSEPPTPISTTTDYESDEYEDPEHDRGRDEDDDLSEDLSQSSITSSSSHGSFANEEDGSESGSESESSEDDDYEESFGAFDVDDNRFTSKEFSTNDKGGAADNDRSDTGDSDISDSESDGDDEDDTETEGEKVKLGQTDDDLFWKRYGYSQQIGNFGDGSSKPFGDDASSSSHDASKSGSESDSDDDDDDDDDAASFDDGDTFKDELYSQAFPSIARMRTEDTRDTIDDTQRSSEKGGGAAAFVEKLKNKFQSFSWTTKSESNNSNSNSNNSRCASLFDCSDVLQGNFKWYITGIVVLVVVIATLAGVMSNKKKNKKIAPMPTVAPVVIDLSPSAAPSISPLPTLPPGQLMESVTFFVLIPNGKDDSITEAELETEFSNAFDLLAPQILFNTTDSTSITLRDATENQAVVVAEEKVNDLAVRRLRGRRRPRKLEALSVKLPILVDITEIVCPEIESISESDLCVRARADIILITDDGTVGFDYQTEMEVAIEGGELQVASDTIGSNLTIVTLDAEDVSTPPPTTSFAPTKSPSPTVSSAPTSSCYNRDPSCEEWANANPSECDVNPTYMVFHCTKACGLCTTESPTPSPSASPTNMTSTSSPIESPTNLTTPAPTVSPANLTSAPPTSSTTGLPKTMGPTASDNTRLSAAPSPSPCVDENDACAEFLDGVGCLFTKCTLWATEGECDANPSYMLKSCAKACDSCGAEERTKSPTPSPDSDSKTNAPTPSSAPIDIDACVDENDRCAEWAEDDQCSVNPNYMLQNCKRSCSVCQSEGDDQLPPTCVDDNARCPEWAADDECSNNPGYMLQNCKLSCNVCQNEDDDDDSSSLESDLLLGGDGEATSTPSQCVDDNERCAEWAADDQCSSNPGYMLQNCKASCGVCEGEASNDNENENDSEECQDLKTDCYEFLDGDSGACLMTKCFFWAQEGECESNPTYMLDNCSKSCGNC